MLPWILDGTEPIEIFYFPSCKFVIHRILNTSTKNDEQLYKYHVESEHSELLENDIMTDDRCKLSYRWSCEN